MLFATVERRQWSNSLCGSPQCVLAAIFAHWPNRLNPQRVVAIYFDWWSNSSIVNNIYIIISVVYLHVPSAGKPNYKDEKKIVFYNRQRILKIGRFYSILRRTKINYASLHCPKLVVLNLHNKLRLLDVIIHIRHSCYTIEFILRY